MKVIVGTGVPYFGDDGTTIWESPYPNVIYITAVLRRTLKQAWNDPDSEQNWPQYVVASDVTRRLREQGETVIWSSRYGSFRDIGLPGIVYPEQMAEELRDLKRIGGSGINFNYAVPPSWIPYEAKHYLFARLAWDPEAEPLAILDTYYRERFSGSPDEMALYYEKLRSAMERYAYPGGGYSREEAHGRYPDEAFGQGFAELAAPAEAAKRAMAINPDDKQKQLIWLLMQSLEYARGKMEIDQLDQAGNRAEAAAKAADLMDWLEHWHGKGIVYDSSFIRLRLERRFLGPPRELPIKMAPPDHLRVYEFKDYHEPGPADLQPEDPARLRPR